MADTYVSVELPPEEVAETTLLAAETVRRLASEIAANRDDAAVFPTAQIALDG